MAGYLGSTPVPQATQHRESFTATEGQTSFATAGYTPQFLDVFLNGSHLSPADFVATNGSDVVLVVAASADDICDIVSYTPFEVADATFTGTTAVDVATVGGTLGVAGLVSPAAGITVVGSTTVDDILLTAVALPGTGNPSIALRNSDNVVYHQSGSADQIVFLDSGQDTMALFHDDSIQFNIDNSVAFEIDGAGIVTKPRQPAFLVRPNDQTNIPIHATTVIAFGSEVFDTNSDFNASNYTFTAPVTGVYHFSLNLNVAQLDNATAYHWCSLNTTDVNYFVNIISGPTHAADSYHSFTASMLVNLDANDTAKVTMQLANSGTAQMDVISGNSSQFSGFLVC